VTVSIHWRPTGEIYRHFSDGTSSQLTVLNSVFGPKIQTSDIRVLRAMAVASGQKFYDEVADVVEKNGDIQVWGEW
jgi:hypothetical protein